MSTKSLKVLDNKSVSSKFNDQAYASQIVEMRNVQISHVRPGQPGEVVGSGETVQENQVVICERRDSSDEGYTYCMDVDEFNATSVLWPFSKKPDANQWALIDIALADPAHEIHLVPAGYTPCLVECDKREVLLDPDGPYELEPPSSWGADHQNMKVTKKVSLSTPEGKQVEGYPIVKTRDGCFPAQPSFEKFEF